MKRTRTHTLRGRIEVVSGASTAKAQLIVDDGRINTAYKITDFFVWENSGASTSFNAQLSMSAIVLGDDMDASENAQIAWVWQAMGTTGALKEYIIDPDHVIVRDLFITIQDANVDKYNYMIVMEEYSISNDEAIINIIKEGNQALN